MDPRIKPLAQGQFRTSFCVEDIDEKISFGETIMLTTPAGTQEKSLLLVDMPLRTPYMRLYYGVKIKSLKDPMLKKAVADFMFFNPGIDQIGIGKMVQFMVRYLFVQKDNISYETVYPLVYEMSLNPKEARLISDVVVLFQRGSMIPPAERRTISYQARSVRSSKLLGEVIHNATLAVIDKLNPHLMLTKPIVLEETKEHGKEIKSVRTLDAHLKPETQEIFEVANIGRYFKTEKSLKKYKKFVALPPMSMNQAASELGVSKSTVMKYTHIHESTSEES